MSYLPSIPSSTRLAMYNLTIQTHMLSHIHSNNHPTRLTLMPNNIPSTKEPVHRTRGLLVGMIQPGHCIYDNEFGVTPPQSPTTPARIQPTPKRPLFDGIASSPYGSSPSRTVSIHQKLTVDAEHERYVKEKVLPLSELCKTDLVKHWTSASMAHKFSLMHAIAMDVLPAQASSVSSERVFSSSKLTCTRARNRLKANTVESLQILKYALRNRYRNKRGQVATSNRGAGRKTRATHHRSI